MLLNNNMNRNIINGSLNVDLNILCLESREGYEIIPPYPRKVVKDWSIKNIYPVYIWICYIAKVQYLMGLACDQARRKL